MHVEIWSDINCPFCYMGKRIFESALEAFEGDVTVEYKSYQLHPEAPKEPNMTADMLVATKFNLPIERAREMNRQVAARAAEVGLEYHMDKVRLVNVMDAHRISHLAKERGKMSEVMEKMFASHFTYGESVADRDVLIRIATSVGLPKEDVEAVLDSDRYEDAVEQDQYEAAQIGVRGVPFFLFNRKYAVSGAQPKEVFLQVLEQVRQEEVKERIKLVNVGDACFVDGCS